MVIPALLLKTETMRREVPLHYNKNNVVKNETLNFTKVSLKIVFLSRITNEGNKFMFYFVFNSD